MTQFNWALDHFDAIGSDRPALWIVEEDGTEDRRTFAEMTARSNRVANHLRGLGVGRGDHVLLMLGNTVPLWEAMLAAMKLGAVMIPASTLLGPDDLVDRVERGDVKAVVAAAELAPRFAAVPGAPIRVAVGGDTPAGWQPFADADGADDTFMPDGPTAADDPLLLYFTSGTTSKPKLVLAHPQQLPGRPPVDHVLDRPAAGRHPPQHLLAGVGQACVELLLRPLERPGDGVPLQLRPLRRAGPARHAWRAAASPPSAPRPRSGAC